MQDNIDTDPEKSRRIFYALWPDDDTRTAFCQLQKNMQGRLTRPQDLHLTLAFLGKQPGALLPALKEILWQLPKIHIPLEIDQIGYFSRNRIAWAGMQHVPEALMTLQSSLMQCLHQHAIGSHEHTDFRPHITLARNAPPPAQSPIAAIHWRPNQIVLVESVPQPEGSCYRILATC